MTRTPSEARAPRMEPLARLPVFFALANKRAVIAGGSTAAAWKAELLTAAGAAVEVYAPNPSDEMIDIAAQASISIHRRVIEPLDFTNAALAVGAFENDGEAAFFECAVDEPSTAVADDVDLGVRRKLESAELSREAARVVEHAEAQRLVVIAEHGVVVGRRA